MKNIYKIFSSIFILFLLIGCAEDFSDNNEFAKNIAPPSNVSASFDITQDNTGMVTITPTGEGAISFVIDYGDGSPVSSSVKTGGNVTHAFKEGNHTVKVTAKGLNNLSTTAEVNLVVSFNAPENLQVTIENDTAVSKKVNVTATADWATVFDFVTGETGADPVTVNIGETASFTYKEAGTYSVKVVARGAAIATTEWTMDFEVTAILAPTVSAPAPPSRPSSTVTSVFSDAYTAVGNVNMNPDWGQMWQGSGYAELDLNGDKITHYSKMSYQGVTFDDINVSGMEYLHIDAWTADMNQLKVFTISRSTGDPHSVSKDLTKDEWTSIDIPIKEFTDQGASWSDIFQFKFETVDQWTQADVFVDNIYFWKNNPIGLPINFDKGEEFEPKGGFTFEIANDPENANNKAGKIVTSGEWWDTAEITLDNPIKIISGGNNVYSVKIHSPDVPDASAGDYSLMMKLQGSPDGEFIEISKPFNKKGWNTITFDFSTITSQSYPNSGQAFDGTADFSRLVFFINEGEGRTGTFYIDDIEQFVPGSSTVTAGTLISSFEVAGDLSGFDGGAQEVISNPDTSGNSSDKVLKLVKNDGQTWAGHKFTVTDKFKLDSEQKLRVKVWSPRVGLNFMMKFEDAAGWPNTTATAEVSATSTVANQWEELTYDFSGLDTSVEWYNLVMFMDNGTKGDGSSNFTIYIDDITQYSSSGSSVISDFEVAGDLSGFDGGAQEVISNPDTSGNSSDKVLKLVKNDGQTWAGHKFTVTDKFKLDSEQKLRVKVWSPRVGLNFMMKFEDAAGWPNTTATAEVSATSTVANQWEELTYDFSGLDTSVEWYNLVMFMDNGTKGDGSSNFTIYIDDITQY